jgi:hypothetical protein
MFAEGSHPFTVVERSCDRKWFHLDPAGCDGDHVQLCTKCVDACEKKMGANRKRSKNRSSFVVTDSEAKPFSWPKSMVIGGSDFGQPTNIGLDTNLSMLERLAISPVRIFDCIIKLHHKTAPESQCQNVLKGHMISMPQNTPDRVTHAMLNINTATHPQLVENVHITFVGSKDIWGKLLSRGAILGTIRADAKKIIKWLVALSIFHEHDSFSHLRHQFFDGAGQFDNTELDVASSQQHLDAQLAVLLEDATIADDVVSTRMEADAGAPLHEEDCLFTAPERFCASQQDDFGDGHEQQGRHDGACGVGFERGQAAKYKPTGEVVTVVEVHQDDVEPYFTIQMRCGTCRQTTIEHLDHVLPPTAGVDPAADVNDGDGDGDTARGPHDDAAPVFSHVLWNHEPTLTEGIGDPGDCLLRTAMNMAQPGRLERDDDDDTCYVQAAGGNEPLTEFEENATIITCGFPDLFFLGKGVDRKGSVSASTRAHWLHHHSMRFEKNPQLLFLMFNQLQRHEACRQVSASVSSNPVHVKKLQELLARPDFVEVATAALEDRECQEGKALLRQIEKLIQMSGKAIPYSAMERKSAISQLYSLVQFYGLPSWFVTVSPDDTNSRIVMTISNRFAWEKTAGEPGTNDGDAQAPKLQDKVEWSVACDYPKRARQLADNPVAAAKYFAAMAEAMMEHLCQLKCNHVTKRTTGHSKRKVGVLGKTLAHFAALECQGRGSLHFHAVIWSGLTPELLQALASNDPELRGLRDAAADVLDSMARAKLSPTRHESRDDDKDLRNNNLNETGPISRSDAMSTESL